MLIGFQWDITGINQNIRALSSMAGWEIPKLNGQHMETNKENHRIYIYMEYFPADQV